MGRKCKIDCVSSYTPEYYKQYYHAKNETLTCEICNKPVKKFGIYVHNKGQKHLFNKEIIRLNGLLDAKELGESNPDSLGEINNIV